MSPKQTLLRAAELLEEEAALMKESLSIDGDGDWDTGDIAYKQTKADYDERIAVAANVRLYVKHAL